MLKSLRLLFIAIGGLVVDALAKAGGPLRLDVLRRAASSDADQPAISGPRNLMASASDAASLRSPS